MTGVGPVCGIGEQAMLVRPETDDPSGLTIYCELGPFNDPKSDFLCLLNRRKTPHDEHNRGIYKLLRLFIDWIPFVENTQEPSFVLNHPDLDIQNVIVSPEGKLSAIINWDGVAAVPRCVGNESYPSWLTRDFDTVKYAFGVVINGFDCSVHENSPEALTRYRAIYAQFMETSLRSWNGTRALVQQAP